GYRIEDGGALSPQTTQGSGPVFGVRFAPDGSRLYGVGSGNVYGFDAHTGPLFIPTAWSSLGTFSEAANLVFNPAGTVMLVTGGGPLRSYTLGEAGLPPLAAEATFTTGGCGAGIVFVPEFKLRGDVNGDGRLSIEDVFYLLNNLFAGGPAPIGSGDVDSD